jgi:hypothetical protein
MGNERGGKVNKTGSQANIECPIGLFSRQEAEIVGLTEKINRECTAAEKAPHTQDLIEAVTVLLACEAYDKENLNCRLCHSFSELRRKTAALVVRAGHLNC